MTRNVAGNGSQHGPKYRRIYLELRETLSEGAYKRQGGKLPSEGDLAKRFSVPAGLHRTAGLWRNWNPRDSIQKRMGAGTIVTNRTTRKHFCLPEVAHPRAGHDRDIRAYLPRHFTRACC